MSEPVARALSLLGDPEFVVENLPGVVGLSGGRVRVVFRRWLFRFSDEYLVRAAHDGARGESEIVLEGLRSRARMLFRRTPLGIATEVSYEGPRKRIVLPRLREAAEALVRAAEERAREEAARAAPTPGSEHPLSGAVADLGWLAELLMRSTLLDTVMVEAGEGFEARLADVARRYQGDYEAVYISARGEGVELRAIYSGGRLLGAYARVAGEEYSGVEALRRARGRLVARVYGVISMPSAPGVEGVRSGAEASA